MQVESVLVIEPKIAKHRRAWEGFTMCLKDDNLFLNQLRKNYFHKEKMRENT